MHKQTHLKTKITAEQPFIKYTPEMFGFHNLSGTGLGTTICVVTDGKPDNKYVNNVKSIVNFTTNKELADSHGEGTVVSGILTGKNQHFEGMCPDASLFIAKAIDGGILKFDAAIAAVLWGIINHVDIIAIPTPLEDSCDVLMNTLDKAIDNNILVVMADSGSYPALSVRDFEDKDLGKMSCFVTNNTICINGKNVYSTFLNDGFAYCQGVSCSVALIAGVASILIEKNKTQGTKYNPKLLLNQLMQSVIESPLE